MPDTSIEDRARELGIQVYETKRAPKNPHKLGWWWRPIPWRGVKHNHGPFATDEAALADAALNLMTAEATLRRKGKL